jgi:hypothetical protein
MNMNGQTFLINNTPTIFISEFMNETQYRWALQVANSSDDICESGF